MPTRVTLLSVLVLSESGVITAVKVLLAITVAEDE